MVSASAYSQTPVVNIIKKYADARGARSFVARDGRMKIARPILKNTPVGPLSDQVEEVSVLKMQNAPDELKSEFENELASALTSYQYHGKHDTRNGIVDVYVLLMPDGMVHEMVIYNPGIYSLNSLCGIFTPESLLKLKE